ncbi:type VI secretion system contractile sheath small subunit [Massilia sp. Root335]|jgi:type VI secretion system protein ImpB|uniref:type VI secretion system contractile sheath small subunit n=1 Tax=Massilia sp. Root335 TaxID=1736517 RepID=UPI0006FE78EB|nr:type VI secretion system contractile sheath small subunit [Massilia sp. Root335]KQV52478.1 type VI secretion protein [Massilia sp. Root335]
MAKNESVQKRLQKVRAPRVQMTYDVEIGDAIENKELPFVVGVLGDFGTDPDAAKKRLKDRKFVNVDADNFDEVLGGVAPATSFRVPNHLSAEGGEFAVQLQFKQMDDFRPEAVVQQVAPLKGLLDARAKLADLRNKLAGNDKLEDLLNDVLTNTEKLDSLRKGGGKPGKEEA